jgi:RHS repeat-associated protein
MGIALPCLRPASRRRRCCPGRRKRLRGPRSVRVIPSLSCLPEDPANQPFSRPMTTFSASDVRYYGYRDYTPHLGRWVSMDPLLVRSRITVLPTYAEFARRIDENPYQVTGNAVVNAVDPSGESYFGDPPTEAISTTCGKWHSLSRIGQNPGSPCTYGTSGNPAELRSNDNIARFEHAVLDRKFARLSIVCGHRLCNTPAGGRHDGSDNTATARLSFRNECCCERFRFSCIWSYDGFAWGSAGVGHITVTTPWGQRDWQGSGAYPGRFIPGTRTDYGGVSLVATGLEEGELDVQRGATVEVIRLYPYLQVSNPGPKGFVEAGLVTCQVTCAENTP